MHREFRRVVTGHDATGKAIIESDKTAFHYLERPNRPGVRLTNFWLSGETPAEYDGATETCEGPFILHPPANGSVFRCVEFLPEDREVLATLDGQAAFAEMGAGANIVEDARHPFMHRTDSLDYAVVLSGEIMMLMDDEADDVHLKAGDVIVQRGTNHAWSNRFSEPCVIAFILIDGVTRSDAPEPHRKGIPQR
ncbi:cupin domain-containing protein [Tropicimonas sp. TH_r6]|uniref:cupin domain-containing protein n=1 Tax=Tropicimonas sp. TH_r6 TaxID=3082085 RepID=UPI0029536098|nr:cupin domain-containing protein [Tropicimonas sp. TH_r6]MDV7142198.1 cupin domain-containing protein [Tropicimonas sp. TH_r6]